MTFYSYAPNFEDVILHRVFSELRKGFYVDVGAQDPSGHSLTKAFYDLGWCGINIEPAVEYYAELCKQRTRDINIRACAAECAGKQILFQFSKTGYSTTVPKFAERAVDRGEEFKKVTVPTISLDDIFELNNVRHVDFLKIDVEGAEKQVLLGCSFSKVRPTVLVIEATEPCSTKPNHQNWEPYVLDKGYEMVYFDGLNRFYLAKERLELRERFGLPPNVFDNYVRVLPVHELMEQVRLRGRRFLDRITKKLVNTMPTF